MTGIAHTQDSRASHGKSHTGSRLSGLAGYGPIVASAYDPKRTVRLPIGESCQLAHVLRRPIECAADSGQSVWLSVRPCCYLDNRPGPR